MLAQSCPTVLFFNSFNSVGIYYLREKKGMVMNSISRVFCVILGLMGIIFILDGLFATQGWLIVLGFAFCSIGGGLLCTCIPKNNTKIVSYISKTTADDL